MITIKNVKTLSGTIQDLEIESPETEILDVEGQLLALPALIDLNVSFETPGHSEREDWITGAQSAIAGGVSMVCDSPLSSTPPTISPDTLELKKNLVEKQLAEADIPLRYRFWMGASKEHIHEIGKVKDDLIGVMIDLEAQELDRAFQIAAQHDLIVGAHTENPNPSTKSLLEIIELTERYAGQLYLPQVRTKEELEIIRLSKKREILIYAGTAPHHLFLNNSSEDQQALWEAIHEGLIEIMASDHTPRLFKEKHPPCSVPEIETMLPLLLNAHHTGKISLEKIVQLTVINPRDIFRLKRHLDYVLVDLNIKKEVCNELVKSKCGWSPYAGMTLQGWPKYTILNGQIFPIK